MNEHGNDFVEDDPMAAPMRPRGDMWEQTKHRAIVARERTEFFLRENPVPLIIGALGLGLAIGLAIRFSSDEKEKSKSPIDHFNWSFLSLPFLWPALKSLKEKYDDSTDVVKDNVDRYAKPIRKRWKTWAH
jgi:hypothetical protein